MSRGEKMKEIVTASSGDIARLTGKTHPEIVSEIKNQLKTQQLSDSAFRIRYRDKDNLINESYLLDKEQTDMLLVRYPLPVYAKALKGLKEIESVKYTQGLNPKNFKEALQNILSQEKEETSTPKIVSMSAYLKDDYGITTERFFKKEKKDGYVYLLKQEGYFKIGITTNKSRRLKKYVTENPMPFECVFMQKLRDYRNVETKFIRHFKKNNLHHEWFEFSENELEKAMEFLKKEFIQ